MRSAQTAGASHHVAGVLAGGPRGRPVPPASPSSSPAPPAHRARQPAPAARPGPRPRDEIACEAGGTPALTWDAIPTSRSVQHAQRTLAPWVPAAVPRAAGTSGTQEGGDTMAARPGPDPSPGRTRPAPTAPASGTPVTSRQEILFRRRDCRVSTGQITPRSITLMRHKSQAPGRLAANASPPRCRCESNVAGG
jgi:hypothetical protein